MSEPVAARRSLGGIALRIALLGGGLVALWFALRDASWARTRAMVGQIGAPVLLIAAPQGLAFVLHGIAWREVLAALGPTRSPASLVALFNGAEAVRMTFPGGPAAGDAFSVWLLKIRCAVDLGAAVSSVATKKLLVVISNAIYAAIAFALLVAYPRVIRVPGLGERGLYLLLAGWVATLALIAAAMIAGMISGGLASRFGRAVARVPFAQARSWSDARKADWEQADRQLAHPVARERLGRLVFPGALLLLQWFTEAAETWLILHLIGVDAGIVPPLTIEVCAGLLRSAAFAIPGSVGVQDAGYVALLAAFGVPDAASAGAAFVLLKRAKELVWIVTGYAILAAWGATPRAFSGRRA